MRTEYGQYRRGPMPSQKDLKEMEISCGQCLNHKLHKGHRHYIEKNHKCYRYPNVKRCTFFVVSGL